MADVVVQPRSEEKIAVVVTAVGARPAKTPKQIGSCDANPSVAEESRFLSSDEIKIVPAERLEQP